MLVKHRKNRIQKLKKYQNELIITFSTSAENHKTKFYAPPPPQGRGLVNTRSLCRGRGGGRGLFRVGPLESHMGHGIKRVGAWGVCQVEGASRGLYQSRDPPQPPAVSMLFPGTPPPGTRSDFPSGKTGGASKEGPLSPPPPPDDGADLVCAVRAARQSTL